MSDYTRRERVEYVLSTPTNATELDKACAGLVKEFGPDYGDDTFTVRVEGDCIVLSFTR